MVSCLEVHFTYLNGGIFIFHLNLLNDIFGVEVQSKCNYPNLGHRSIESCQCHKSGPR